MSSVALTPGAVGRPAVNYWVVAGVVVVPTFMEILDTTIANVALRYIAGGLSAAQTDADWVITSYLAANAVVLPITGWLSAHLGRRNYFLLSITVFTLAALNRRQAARLLQLSDYLHASRRLYMFELLVPPEPAQLQRLGNDRIAYDLQLRPTLMVQAIQELQDSGVEPDVWKPEAAAGVQFEPFIRQRLEAGSDDVYGEAHRQLDRILLPMVLEFAGGNQRLAARALGIARQTFRQRLRDAGLSLKQSYEDLGDPR